jgi:predicted DNA-binding transcriptional regulator YafY
VASTNKGSARRQDSQQLTRQWAVLRLLCETDEGLSVKELAERLDVSKPTIERDIATLQDDFAILDEQVGKQKKLYRIDHQIRELETLRFAVGELLAIYAALAGAVTLAGTPLYGDLQSVLLKIRGSLGPGHIGGLDALQRVFAAHPRAFVDYGPYGEHIDELTDAIARRRICNIKYHAAWKGTTRAHEVMPIRLVWHRSSLYLFACLGDPPRIATFAVHRIQELEKTEVRFEPPPGIDVDEYIAKAFGIFVSDLEEEVEILFDSEIAWRIEEQTFHPEEKKHRLPDGRLIYRIRTSAQWEIIPWVRSFGALAELVAPRVWRDVLHANLEAAAARYRKSEQRG